MYQRTYVCIYARTYVCVYGYVCKDCVSLSDRVALHVSITQYPADTQHLSLPLALYATLNTVSVSQYVALEYPIHRFLFRQTKLEVPAVRILTKIDVWCCNGGAVSASSALLFALILRKPHSARHGSFFTPYTSPSVRAAYCSDVGTERILQIPVNSTVTDAPNVLHHQQLPDVTGGCSI
jgi:hypothetical protein